ncbi:MAG: tetratricopeptide repeat protein [Nitrosopumilaceae archaeon]|nr:tetratricopeptide repeat protein [Nitrosopumilaceae archaeon]
MPSPLKIRSPTPEIQRQTMSDVFKNLIIIEELLEQKADPNISNYITIRLVTILEQFCREIIQHQIDKKGISVHREITIQTDDLDMNKDRSKGSIISISYNFQNADEIKKQFCNYGIEIDNNSAEMDKIKELTDKRHNVVHSVSTIDYDAKRGYDAVEKFMKHICKKAFNTGLEFYILKGVALVLQYQFHKAVECFDEAIKLDGKKSTIYLNKGHALQFLNKNDEAIECFDKAIKLGEKSSNLYLHKGFALYSLGKSDEAIECFDREIKLEPKNGHLHLYKGFALYSLGKSDEVVECFDEAVECFDREIKLEPKNGALYMHKGYALHSLGKSDEAIECFDKAIKLGEKRLILYIHKGSALKSLGKSDEAIECFEEAIRIKPDYPTAYRFIAKILHEQGKHDKAEEYDSKAKSLS